MCEGLIFRVRSNMYSKEFMKFLYGYLKEDFKPQRPDNIEIRFDKKRGGKLADIKIPVENK